MDRRQFLVTGGALIAAGSAGCIGNGSGGGELGTVTTWVPAATALSPDLDHYQFNAWSPASVAEVIDDPHLSSSFAPSTRVGNVAASDVDAVIQANPQTNSEAWNYSVYVGTFESDWIETKLQNQEYVRDSGREDFDVYHREGDGAIAVSEEVIVEATHRAEDPDAVRLAETLIDASEEAVDRYADTNPDMEVLTDELPDYHSMNARTFERVENTTPEAGALQNQVGYGTAMTLSGEETEVTDVLVFLDENDVVERDIEAYIEESGEFSDYRSQPEYEINGRAVVIEGTRVTQNLGFM